MRGPLLGAIALALAAGAANAQVFDLGTGTLHLPQLTVGSNLYDVVLRYDADGRLTISQLAQATPSIVGSWHLEQAGAPGYPKLRMTFTFLADGTYMLADDSSIADPSGQPGVEVGAYTYDGATGAFSSACPHVNTDGQWGLSHNRQFGLTGCTGTAANITVQGNVMSVTVQNPAEGNPQITLARVTP